MSGESLHAVQGLFFFTGSLRLLLAHFAASDEIITYTYFLCSAVSALYFMPLFLSRTKLLAHKHTYSNEDDLHKIVVRDSL